MKVKVKSLSHVRLFATPWTVAYQAPQSMEFSRQEYWSGLPFPSPGYLPNPGIEPGSPALKADSFLFVCLFSCHFLQNSGMDPILPWNCSHTGSGSAQHMQADSSPAESPGSPRILEWVSYPFSSGSSRPRD